MEILGTRSHFSGPLPPPEIIEAYERILPGSANRILTMAEKNQDHRIEMELKKIVLDGDETKKLISSGIQRVPRGQWFGFIITIAFLVAATICAWVGHPFTASILGLGGATNLVALFLRPVANQNFIQKDS